jgi:hypothetical protein
MPEYWMTYVERDTSYPALLVYDSSGAYVEVNKERLQPDELGLGYLVTSDQAAYTAANAYCYRVELIPDESKVAVRRAKLGRPRLPANRQRVPRGVALLRSEWDALERIAASKGLSLGHTIGLILEKWTNENYSNPLTDDRGL